MTAFETWWEQEGSAMRPLDGEDAEMHVKRVCAIAWKNGAYKQGSSTITCGRCGLVNDSSRNYCAGCGESFCGV